MVLFDQVIREVKGTVLAMPQARALVSGPEAPWQPGGNRNIVLKEDVGIELGGPECESLSCVLWTNDLSLVSDGAITLAGPDFSECMGEQRPFARIVLAGVEGFTEDNACERHTELDLVRYDLDLKGFMIRAVSRRMNEWCRISRSALRDGFSAQVLGSSLMGLMGRKPYVRSLEMLFVTSCAGDVARLKDLTSHTARVIAAMSKMAGEMSFDCGECEYQDVCDDATDLKKMRKSIMRKGRR
jgi:CO dehydrogenase/acetyl-CoA synthase beta subunit